MCLLHTRVDVLCTSFLSGAEKLQTSAEEKEISRLSLSQNTSHRRNFNRREKCHLLLMPVTKMYGPHAQVNINSTEVELVQSFVYLGSQLEANDTCDTKMRRRMAMTLKCFINYYTVLR